MGRWVLDLAFVWKAVFTLGLVLLYYCFSIGITFYNKWLTKSFHFPLFMTMLHLAVIFLFSALSRALVQCSSHRARVVLSWTDYLRRVAPTALATALDVGLSNWSFLYITVSLYTMTKSSAILFILIFSLIFKLEELRAALVLVVLLIAGGLFMFTYKSTQFNVEGFALVLGASFIGGIRWTLTQMLLQKDELGLQNPIDTMFHLQPLMFLGLFPLFAVFEGHRAAPAGTWEPLPWWDSCLWFGLLRVPPGLQDLQPHALHCWHFQGGLHFVAGGSPAGRSDQPGELAGLCPLPLGNIPTCGPQSPALQR
ncbi:PREDICTED: solute carrier family 35 member C2 isoform X2 [Chinchilla lanigera]|uniref:solute carrier family 35 member C2 isoform X2 n=1 Tax=Chinchilla lanigera TaxID=34839 RepID=UPI00038EAF5D|nr:PREDICTED: solute carrier family 35 member C2 isoform X2 [Chinchilla lanigera]